MALYIEIDKELKEQLRYLEINTTKLDLIELKSNIYCIVYNKKIIGEIIGKGDINNFRLSRIQILNRYKGKGFGRLTIDLLKKKFNFICLASLKTATGFWRKMEFKVIEIKLDGYEETTYYYPEIKDKEEKIKKHFT